jgi:hypothetical protein
MKSKARMQGPQSATAMMHGGISLLFTENILRLVY